MEFLLTPYPGSRFIQTQARVELLNQLNGEKVFGITWMADRYDTEKYKRRGWCYYRVAQRENRMVEINGI